MRHALNNLQSLGVVSLEFLELLAFASGSGQKIDQIVRAPHHQQSRKAEHSSWTPPRLRPKMTADLLQRNLTWILPRHRPRQLIPTPNLHTYSKWTRHHHRIRRLKFPPNLPPKGPNFPMSTALCNEVAFKTRIGTVDILHCEKHAE